MAHHQLSGASIPWPTALSGSGNGWSASPDGVRQKHLSGVTHWLIITRISGVVAEQRHRANREWWQIEKRRLWGEPTAHQVDDELRHFAITTLRWLPPLDAAAGRERG